MRERAECVAAERALQRAVTGDRPVDELEEALALAHARTCPVCVRRFELAAAHAYSEGRDTFPAVADAPVDPRSLRERALTAALSEPEAIVRRRAAERLGDLEQVGPAALAELVRVAAEDRDETVRAAALKTLDGEVSLPLVSEESETANRLIVRGESGVLGEIVRRKDEFWMKLNGLPVAFEQTRPVVAIPAALEEGEVQIEWSGESAGLVFAREPVAEGALELYLGNVPDPAASRALVEKLFSRVYLLSPRERAGGV